MVSEKDLRDIIAQVLTEMNVSDGATASAVEAAVAGKASPQNGTEIEDGCWDDVAAVRSEKTVSGRKPGSKRSIL